MHAPNAKIIAYLVILQIVNIASLDLFQLALIANNALMVVILVIKMKKLIKYYVEKIDAKKATFTVLKMKIFHVGNVQKKKIMISVLHVSMTLSLKNSYVLNV